MSILQSCNLEGGSEERQQREARERPMGLSDKGCKSSYMDMKRKASGLLPRVRASSELAKGTCFGLRQAGVKAQLLLLAGYVILRNFLTCLSLSFFRFVKWE